MLIRPCDDPRLLEGLRHACGPLIMGALEDPEVIEIMLRAGQEWSRRRWVHFLCPVLENNCSISLDVEEFSLIRCDFNMLHDVAICFTYFGKSFKFF